MWDKFKTPNQDLEKVTYEIRGPLLQEAMRLEAQGHKVLKLNIGNPAAFGFEVPEVFLRHFPEAVTNFHGYCDSKGHLDARKAILEYNHAIGVGRQVTDLSRVFVGNGVSELITIVTRAILQKGDECLIPAPDYPLWTAAVSLAGGKPLHYLCDPDNGWRPDLADIRSKITPRTKALVLINPNNPTGVVYDRETLQGLVDIAKEHELILLSDEIYDRILYNGAKHIPIASLDDQVLAITFNGASKANRLCGYRLGWMFLTGDWHEAPAVLAALEKLTSMRLCSVSPFQALIRDCLFTDDSIKALCAPGGRLYEQAQLCYRRVNQIEGLSCTPVDGALYTLARIDFTKLNFASDFDFAWKLLQEEHVLVVHSAGFNWPKADGFRIVFLPNLTDLNAALDGIERLCKRYAK